ncbi:MAG: DNA polymerase III subunit chi [Gammaproteobacteria bacterium]|jgi:DNA polymerase-3 subunit chi|nr:DNA polymerase III subunit chi [Gammaproteobacteria bacterium]
MRVDFYILEDTAGDRELLSCRIAEKAYKSELRVFVLASDRTQATRLDELLWTFRDGSFVPHALNDAEVNREENPVLIGTDGQPVPPADVMINLTDAVPACCRQFERVVEIVAASEDSRRLGRERFRRYRELGLDPQSHRIS